VANHSNRVAPFSSKHTFHNTINSNCYKTSRKDYTQWITLFEMFLLSIKRCWAVYISIEKCGPLFEWFGTLQYVLWKVWECFWNWESHSFELFDTHTLSHQYKRIECEWLTWFIGTTLKIQLRSLSEGGKVIIESDRVLELTSHTLHSHFEVKNPKLWYDLLYWYK
jgi:hypothetical protein